jgi:Xaa-Pro aminopeptidase
VADNEYAARRRAVVEGLAGRKLDSLLVVLSPNLRYLSGFTGSNGALLIAEDRVTLFTDPRYTLQAARETAGRCSPAVRVRTAKGALVSSIALEIAKLKLRRIGYEPARMTCDSRDALSCLLPLGAALTAAGGWIEQLRMVKSAAELSRIRRSVLTNSKAFEAACRRLRTGVSEQDFAAELEYRMRRFGAEKPAFETIVASGVRSALPHAQPTAKAMKSGELVVVDMGACQDGYASDMTRMMFLGSPGSKVKRAYAAVLEAQLAAIDAVKPGVVAHAIDRVARRVLRRHGLERAFIHSTGHGLGLEIHEPPRIGKRDQTILQAGMAITIEPGVYIEGWGGIRIEDTVVVTSSGCEVLTPTAKALHVI